MGPRGEIGVGVNLGGVLPGGNDLDDRCGVVEGVGRVQRLHQVQHERTDVLGWEETDPKIKSGTGARDHRLDLCLLVGAGTGEPWSGHGFEGDLVAQ
ncbi:MAG: hypothetical protein ACRDQU_10505, partial [Pseudonocardiaceae bacterium]